MLGRRYPKAVLPNVLYPLSTKAFPAKTLGCEGKIVCENKNLLYINLASIHNIQSLLQGAHTLTLKVVDTYIL